MCLEGRCRDPDKDEDGDGLNNIFEFNLGTDPLKKDSDHDGIDDGEEVGEAAKPADTDGDRILDALESAVNDSDGDCLPDQFDPENYKYRQNQSLLAAFGCKLAGVCGKWINLVKADCVYKGSIQGEIQCDYSSVPGYEENESSCDNLDNDCDGDTDENSFYQGKGVGELCYGAGECGAGYVECSLVGAHATCSTNPDGSDSNAVEEKCDTLDNDCDGIADNGIFYKGIPLGSLCDGEGECGEGVVECGIDGGAVCSTDKGGSEDQSGEEICDNKDNDCDGMIDNDPVFNPVDANCMTKGVCGENVSKIKGDCVAGVWVCDYSDVDTYESPLEKSCDGFDNNCNGMVDEDFYYKAKNGSTLKIGSFCGEGACAGGIVTCSADKTFAICDTESLAKEEVCDFLDNDCDGLTDNGLKMDFGGSVIKISDGTPTVRKSPALAYIKEENSIYLFGGATGTDKMFNSVMQANDLWRYSTDEGVWDEIEATGDIPDPREGGILFKSPTDKKLRLFGGVRVEEGVEKTLWDIHKFDADLNKWDFAGFIENAPKVENPLYLYEPGGVVFVYGTNPTTGKEIFLSVDLNDLTIKNLKNNPAGLKEMSPLQDAAKGIIYFFGGVDAAGGVSKKVFAYDSDGDSWSELNVKNPPPARKGAAFVINPAGDEIYMFGGVEQTGKFSGETWRLNLSTGLWSLEPLSPSPQPVKDAMFLNAEDFGILLSGILHNGKINRDIWHFNLLVPEWVKELAPVIPSDRIQASQVFSQKRRAWYLFGGLRSEINGYSPVSTIIKYSVEEESWTEKQMKIEEASFIGSAVALDNDNDTVYLHGGVKFDENTGSEKYSDKLFQLSLIDYSISEIKAGGKIPGARAFHSMDYYKEGKYLVLYGGKDEKWDFNDIYIYKIDLNEWEYAGKAGDKGRYGHRSALDAEKDMLILYGGYGNGSLLLINLYNFSWSETPLVEEAGETNPLFMYDFFSSILLAGGKKGMFFIVDLADPGSPKFSQAVLTSEKPLPLFPHSIFDPVKRRGLIFGGMDFNGNTVNSFFKIDQNCP